MKPTIEEILQNFAKWHGTEWETPNGVRMLTGVSSEAGYLGFTYNFYRLDECTPVEKPMVVYMYKDRFIELQNGYSVMVDTIDEAGDIPFIQLTESVKQVLKEGGIEYDS